MVYNIMTCQGWDPVFMGGCSLAWLTFAALFFIAAFARKWLGEEQGIDFSFIFSLVVGFLADLIVISITGNFKWGLLAGFVGVLAGGYGAGLIGFGGDE